MIIKNNVQSLGRHTLKSLGLKFEFAAYINDPTLEIPCEFHPFTHCASHLPKQPLRVLLAFAPPFF